MLGDIGQIAIVCKDVKRAKAFYADVLKLPFLFEAPGLAFFKAGSVRLMLSGAESKEFERCSSVLYFNVTGLEAEHAALKERGAKFRDAPHLVHQDANGALWMAFFEDTEGNVAALMETKPA